MSFKITGRGIKVTSGIRKKIDEMMKKHRNFLKIVNKIEIKLRKATSHSGVKSDLEVEITMTMPKAIIRVEEVGDEFYTIIDKIDPIIRRRLVRYHDHKRKWSGQESWRETEMKVFNEELENIQEDTYADGVFIAPVISRDKQLGDNLPMHPVEAIERMELMGHESFLFKNIETGKCSMIYKKSNGTFGLVESSDD